MNGRIRKPNPRTFKIGDVIGAFEVIGFEGRRDKAGVGSEWQYKCRCKCGNEHLRTQSQITTRRQGCQACAGKRIAQAHEENRRPEHATEAAAEQALTALRRMGWAA